jgi:MFS family permease
MLAWSLRSEAMPTATLGERDHDCAVPGLPRRLATASVMACLVATAFVGSVVTTAMPTIARDLGGRDLYAWVFTVYLVASTLAVALAGKVADRFGRRPVFTFGMALFVVGSVLCGASGTMGELVFFRAIQGLGAGVIAPISTTIAADLYTLEERAKVHGLFTGAWGGANVIGPPLGGLICASTSWRWVFLLNVPVGLVALALLLLSYGDARRTVRADLDWPGAILAAFVVSSFVVATGQSTVIAPALRFSLAAAALVGLFAFVRHERRAADPLLPIAELRDPAVRLGAVGSLFVGAIIHAPAAFVPLWLSWAMPDDPVGASWALVPLLAGWAIGSTLGVRVLVRKGLRFTALRGLALAGLGATLFAMVVAFRLPMAATYAALGALGLGLGPAANAFLLGSQARVAWQSRGAVTSLVHASRALGGSLAIGLLATVAAVSAGPLASHAPLPSAIVPGPATFGAFALLVWVGLLVVVALSRRSDGWNSLRT